MDTQTKKLLRILSPDEKKIVEDVQRCGCVLHDVVCHEGALLFKITENQKECINAVVELLTENTFTTGGTKIVLTYNKKPVLISYIEDWYSGCVPKEYLYEDLEDGTPFEDDHRIEEYIHGSEQGIFERLEKELNGEWVVLEAEHKDGGFGADFGQTFFLAVKKTEYQ